VSPPLTESAQSARRVALGLGVIYFVWGSTYPALRVVVETVPPWLASAGRFSLAGALLLALLALRGGASRLRLTRRVLASCALVGLLLMTLTQGSMAVALRTCPPEWRRW
jgi:drug/metabolite transporter (DMT)-like permease